MIEFVNGPVLPVLIAVALTLVVIVAKALGR